MPPRPLARAAVCCLLTIVVVACTQDVSSTNADGSSTPAAGTEQEQAVADGQAGDSTSAEPAGPDEPDEPADSTGDDTLTLDHLAAEQRGAVVRVGGEIARAASGDSPRWSCSSMDGAEFLAFAFSDGAGSVVDVSYDAIGRTTATVSMGSGSYEFVEGSSAAATQRDDAVEVELELTDAATGTTSRMDALVRC